jgi:hypothetical protein
VLKAHPGKVTDEAVEKQDGESGLRYSFDIKHGDAAKNQDWAKMGADKALENNAKEPNPD